VVEALGRASTDHQAEVVAAGGVLGTSSRCSQPPSSTGHSETVTLQCANSPLSTTAHTLIAPQTGHG
jgi:hypothetical protein